MKFTENGKREYMRDVFARCKNEINKENRVAVRILARSGLLLSAVVSLVQTFIVGRGASLYGSFFLIGYFALLSLLEGLLLPEDYPNSTFLIYVLEVPVYLTAILMGTVWDPAHQASTVLLFMMVLPVFVLDVPWRSLGLLAGWSSFFALMSWGTKEMPVLQSDLIHILEFFFGSAVLTNALMRVRLESFRNLEKAQYYLEYDRQTGILSRYALASRTGKYIGKRLMVTFADLDLLSLYGDFYGHAAGEQITVFFAHTMRDCFGPGDTYRYGSDEILCILSEGGEKEGLAFIDQAREKLRTFRYEDTEISLSASFGYVTGTPMTMLELHQMIRLADIYAHKVKQQGVDRVLGNAFDQQLLREGIVESNLSSHARSYEISQVTGLPRMSYFLTRSSELLNKIIRLENHPVVGYFKLLHLREYNEAFGYGAGDALIKKSADLLRENFGARHLCHITAGEFGILCYRNEAAEAALRVMESLQTLRPGVSVPCKAGFAEYSEGENMISLLDRARLAYVSIRDRKEEKIAFYSKELDEENRFRQYLISHLDEALLKGWLKVYYQPIARALTGEICNEEALSRWDDPLYGFLMPFRFIPPLEEEGLMYRVNLYVVRQVLRDFDTRREEGLTLAPVSVNLSRRDFAQCDMVSEITSLVDASGYGREMIKIEITESAFISDQELLKKEVDRFRAAGFEVWMDDFGSAYSTLNLLQDLDFDLIKIDMKFVKNLVKGAKNYIIISDIIDMAKRMGITTLIEGVETAEHYEMMRSLGCEKIQGYFFNRPNPLGYILERAKSGTGLAFEDPAYTGYYEAIGRIDLNDPMRHSALREDSRLKREVASGIIQNLSGSQDSFVCLRANESFLEILDPWLKRLREGEDSPLAERVLHPPSEVAGALQKCSGEDWTNIQMQVEGVGVFILYIRMIGFCEASRQRAFLVMVLHDHPAL